MGGDAARRNAELPLHPQVGERGVRARTSPRCGTVRGRKLQPGADAVSRASRRAAIAQRPRQSPLSEERIRAALRDKYRIEAGESSVDGRPVKTWRVLIVLPSSTIPTRPA